MEDTLASKTHAWTCKQACKDPYKANGWHKLAWQAYHRMERKNGKVMHEATGIMAMHPKWLHLNKASWASDVTTQPHACYGHQAWQSLEQERLKQA